MYKHNDSTEKLGTLKNGLILALLWGGMLAAFLQFTRAGRWMAVERTYWAVTLGVGVDLLISLIVLPKQAVMRVTAIVAASAVLIVARSLWNELVLTTKVANVVGRR